MKALRFLGTLFGTAGERYSDVEGARRGAAFSFYALFSIFPLLLLAVTVFGMVLGDDARARDRLLAVIAADPSIRGVVDQTLAAMQSSRTGRGISFVVGLATLLFGASGALAELSVSLNKIWGVPDRKADGVLGTVREVVYERLIGLALVVAIGVTLLASLVTSSVLAGVAAHAPGTFGPALLQGAEIIASIVLMTIVFTCTFHILPRSRPSFRDVIPGALLTTVGLSILKMVFATYLSKLTSYSAYGVFGSVLALATWIYLSAQVIFFGAQVTRVHCELRPGGSCEPKPATPRSAEPLATERSTEPASTVG